MWKRPKIFIPFAAIMLLAGLFLLPRQLADEAPRENLGLMTSLPIYWSDGADIASLAAGNSDTPWVRAELEQRYRLQALDSLAPEGGFDPQQFNRMIIAQPRALSPQDNVALDDWVNGGGRLLIVIDPLLTGRYSVSLSDPRHPMAVGLVPPVLERWGLAIRYDERQPFDLQSVEAEGIEIPIAMAGEVYLLDAGSDRCDVSGAGILAQCEIGEGRITLIPDAALFEFDEGSRELRSSLENITKYAFE